MHLTHIRLRDFRNYRRLDVVLNPGCHVLTGHNAQGKTNFLEAIYTLATLRSFRGVGGAQMIRESQKGFFVGAEVAGQGVKDLRYYWSTAERQLTVNRIPVRKLTDYFGLLKVVVFCSEDIQLVKGTGRIRRRFLDLLLSQTYPHYLELLQRYAKVLRSRNALLKRHNPDPITLESFSRELIKYGNEIIRCRQEIIPRISTLARLAYRRISQGAEEFKLDYQPSVRRDFMVELTQSKAREMSTRVTVVGPHRDDLRCSLDLRPALQFGSEGQKRSIAIALKMAQAEYLTGINGVPPILLIDDVMGELDVNRRTGFIPIIRRSEKGQGQVFMTCTEQNWPSEIGKDLNYWTVHQGQLTRSVGPSKA